MAESFFSKLDPLTWLGSTAPRVTSRPYVKPAIDNPGNGGFFSSLSSWWSKPWGSSIGEGLNNVISGITIPLIPILILAIIGGVIALKILNKVVK